MKSKEEIEYERRLRFAKEFREMYEQLPPWDKLDVLRHIYWLILQRKVREFPLRWVEVQIKLDNEINIHGMPYFIKRWLEQWFNLRPWSDSKLVLFHRVKFWIERFEDNDDFELRLIHRGRWIANTWLETKGDEWILYSLHVPVEKYRNIGLGKYLLAQVLERARVRGAKSIRETIEKDCEWPKQEKEFSALVAWYQRRGFVLTEDAENYFLTLYLHK